MSTQPLPIDQFAGKVRDKYPGAYDHLSDSELVNRVVTKYPAYKDNIASYAPTQFEKERPGPEHVDQPNEGFVSGVQSSLGQPPSLKDTLKDPATYFGPGVDVAKGLYHAAKDHSLAPLVGLNPQSMAERADRGDSAGILGEAALPTALAVAAPVAEGLGKVGGAARGALADRVVRPSGQPTPVARLALGNERARALGEILNPEIGDMAEQKFAKQQALDAGRTAPGPWRPGLKPQAELGSPENPGMHSPIPTSMPKPQVVSLRDSPNALINKDRMLTGQSASLSESPNANINADRALTGQSTPLSESPNLVRNKENILSGQSTPMSESPNRGLKPTPPPAASPFQGMTPSSTASGSLPELKGNPTPFAPPSVKFVDKLAPPTQEPSIIQSPDSTPPAHKVTYQSVQKNDLLSMVNKGNRDAIFEWQRRGYPLPEGVGYLVEKNSSAVPWRNLEK